MSIFFWTRRGQSLSILLLLIPFPAVSWYKKQSYICIRIGAISVCVQWKSKLISDLLKTVCYVCSYCDVGYRRNLDTCVWSLWINDLVANLVIVLVVCSNVGNYFLTLSLFSILQSCFFLSAELLLTCQYSHWLFELGFLTIKFWHSSQCCE